MQISELDDAKTYCRQQMLRIVKEVDNIAKNPELASDEEHLPPFMSAELFKAMMPVLRRHGDRRGGGSSRGSGVLGRIGKREDDEEEGILVAPSSGGYGEYFEGEERAHPEVGQHDDEEL